jgi:AraC-like DNA-binding protein
MPSRACGAEMSATGRTASCRRDGADAPAAYATGYFHFASEPAIRLVAKLVEITPADIALELGLHENTLQRRFREAQGCTVFDYLRRRRLEQARTALRDGATVTDAAFAAG